MTSTASPSKTRSAGVWTADFPQVCLRHSITTILLFTAVVVLVQATPHFFPDNEVDVELVDAPDKRPARLSYFRAPSSRYRGRYGSYDSARPSYRAGYGQNVWWRKKAVNRRQEKDISINTFITITIIIIITIIN
ncbi:hypothetical protein ElyMa_003040100 [Elysia marginata]|uniref:Uncharacterized protein n=1 Tax=Elysia marginata TaxID=1093978 RepID=A0AAV4IJ42_9GAST|nr:hypothetical protein ElyMa_003040100 [Elysia marginata]